MARVERHLSCQGVKAQISPRSTDCRQAGFRSRYISNKTFSEPQTESFYDSKKYEGPKKLNWGRAKEKKLSVDLPRSWPGWNAGCRSSSACREPRARSPTCSRRTPRTCREPGTAPRRSCPWRAMPIRRVTMQSYRSAMDLTKDPGLRAKPPKLSSYHLNKDL